MSVDAVGDHIRLSSPGGESSDTGFGGATYTEYFNASSSEADVAVVAGLPFAGSHGLRARRTSARPRWHGRTGGWGWPGGGWPGALAARAEQQDAGRHRDQHGERSGVDQGGRVQSELRGRHARDQRRNAESEVAHGKDRGHQARALSGRSQGDGHPEGTREAETKACACYR